MSKPRKHKPLTCKQRALAAHVAVGELGKKVDAAVKRGKLVRITLENRIAALEQAEMDRINQQIEDLELGLVGRLFRRFCNWLNAANEAAPDTFNRDHPMTKGKPTWENSNAS